MARRRVFVGVAAAVAAVHGLVLWPQAATRGAAPRADVATAVTVRTIAPPAPRPAAPMPAPAPVHARPAPDAPAVSAAPPAPGGEFHGYYPRAQVERAALPRSAPDVTSLAGLPASGLPVRLQVFVGATGTVDAVRVVQALDDDADLVAGLQRMLRATAFLPARRAGQDVGSVLELEFDLGGT